MAIDLIKKIRTLFDAAVSWRTSPRHSDAVLATSPKKAIVKSRPLTLEYKYADLASEVRCDEQFLRLKDHIYRHLNDAQRPRVDGSLLGSPKFIREAGRLAANRPYFYLQPLNQEGLLFERTAHGWMICKARKVIASSSFLRAYEDWDHVSLHESSDGHVRLSSVRFGFKLVSTVVYQEKLCAVLDNYTAG